jgi:hypothetical protein
LTQTENVGIWQNCTGTKQHVGRGVEDGPGKRRGSSEEALKRITGEAKNLSRYLLTHVTAGSNWRIFDKNFGGFSTILARAFFESTVIVITLIINAFVPKY